MSPLKIKTPVLKKISIECHDQALRPYMLAKDYKLQYEQLSLSKESMQLFQSNHPLHVIQISKNTYKFFSGWFWLSYCRDFNCDKITMIVYSKIELYELKQAAWAYLLSSQFQSFNRHNNLVQLKHYFDSMPDHIKKSLLSSQGTNSSQVMVQQLSNESRSAVRNQKNHMNNSNSSTKRQSIREQLTKRNKNVS